MAIGVLEGRDTVVPQHVRVPAAVADAVSSDDPLRLPVTVVGAALVGVLEAVALLAVALGGLDGVLSSPGRPPGGLVAAGLVLLAGWIVLCAGSAAAMVDGAGRSLLQGVAYAEMVLIAGLVVVGLANPFANPTPLPLPAPALLALAVPVAKLLLAGAPSAQRWIARGPRVRVRRPDPVQAHRVLATLTLGVIGASLCAVAVFTPVPAGDVQNPAASVFPQD